MNFTLPKILHSTPHYLILYKPPGWFVHLPEDRRAQKAFKKVVLTHWFEDVLKIKIFPVQRLDFATEGILMAGTHSEAASTLNFLQREGGIEKSYHTVVRGFTPPQQKIEIPLQSDSSPELRDCITHFETLKQIEIPKPAHPDFAFSRYSFLKVRLETGRWHQIRRHMNRISHPIVGDREHGCSHHNRFWRDQMQVNGLLLKCQQLKFKDPWTDGLQNHQCPSTERWQKVEHHFSLDKGLM
jgi:tRNA pseudouridine65 synthase